LAAEKVPGSGGQQMTDYLSPLVYQFEIPVGNNHKRGVKRNQEVTNQQQDNKRVPKSKLACYLY
jgi:hypothetical protein